MKYRILFTLAFLAIILLYYFFPCLMLSVKDVPGYKLLEKETTNIIFLYGYGICDSCPTGQFLESLKNSKNFLVVVPDDYNDNDIQNLKATFNLEGKIIKGGEDTIEFLKNIAGCNKLDNWHNNYHVVLKNKKYESITVL
jgi:hypothetical protein